MWQERVNNFVTNQSNSNIPIVLISSGGTKVSIEKNEVRTLENFSTGFRGAKSAEYFLESGYRCIFLYRKGHNNYFPYTFTLKTQLSLEIDGEFLLSLDFENIDQEVKNQIIKDQQSLRLAINSNIFLSIGFDTVDDYLMKLERISKILNHVKENSLIYLAAAVSDFYIPSELMSVHKIQSRLQNIEDHENDHRDVRAICTKNNDGGLWQPIFHPVKKVLGDLATRWAPQAYVLSFKLETDNNILINKANMALMKYQVNGVICNLLNTRRDHVKILANNNHYNNHDHDIDDNVEIINIYRSNEEIFIEKELVRTIKNMHVRYMEYHSSSYTFHHHLDNDIDNNGELTWVGTGSGRLAGILCVLYMTPIFFYLK